MGIILSKKSGFTLVEIIVVVIIVGLLTTFALPRFIATFERVRASEGVNLLTALLGAQKAYQLENAAYSTDPDLLEVEITTADNFDIPPRVYDPGDPITNPIAEIDRTGSYTLCINELGTISCKVNTGTFTCAQAGITPVCP